MSLPEFAESHINLPTRRLPRGTFEEHANVVSADLPRGTFVPSLIAFFIVTSVTKKGGEVGSGGGEADPEILGHEIGRASVRERV